MFACVLFSHVNKAIIHVEESIHSEDLALPAGDDGKAFQRTSEGWKSGVGGTVGCKRRTGAQESIIPFCRFHFTHEKKALSYSIYPLHCY